MQIRLFHLCIALALASASADALADTPVDLSHPAAPNAHISISNIKGSVTVSAWNRDEIHVTGRLGEGAKPLAIEGSRHHLKVEVQNGDDAGLFNWGGRHDMGPTTLNLQVPRGVSLDVDLVSSPVNIKGLDGGTVKINSVSGRVRIDAKTRSLDVDSVSGNIEQSGQADRAQLQTVSGDILAPALGGLASVETVSGQIKTSGAPWQKLTVSTVSGDVEVDGGPTRSGKINIDSMSGDVKLALHADDEAAIHASSFSGEIRSDVGDTQESEHGPGSKLTTRIGTGGGQVEIESFSGDVRIQRSR